MTAGQPRRLGVLAADGMLLTCALIWGATFAAQKMATEHMGPLLFNGVRYLIGAAVLAPLAFVRWRSLGRGPARRSAIVGGLLAGTAMAIASSTQQVGMHSTSVSNAGFITGLYVILVPMLGLFVGQRVGWPVWVGAALAVVGLFFLSVMPGLREEGLHINTGDLWVLLCACGWAFHVQVIGWAAPETDPYVISAVQFAVTGVVAFGASLASATLLGDTEWGAREVAHWDGFVQALGPLAFAAIASTCIAFTLQVVAQRSAPPAHAAILLSLESVFAAITEAVCLALGFTALGAPFGAWKWIGCGLMFAGVVLSQWKPAMRAAAGAAARPESA